MPPAERFPLVEQLGVPVKPVLDRIFSRTIKTETGCFEWQGSLSDTGYARISYQRKTRLGARLVMELIHGNIPRTLQACHSCDNRKCINPDHIWIGTQKQNQQDAIRKKRYTGQAKTHCIIGHEYTIENSIFYGANKQKRRCRICMKAHNVKWRSKRLLDGQGRE